MQLLYTMDREEYDSLLMANKSPNVYLEKEVADLREELAKYKMFKRDMELEDDRLASVITDEPITVKEALDTYIVALHTKHSHKTKLNKTKLLQHIADICNKSVSYVRKVTLSVM